MVRRLALPSHTHTRDHDLFLGLTLNGKVQRRFHHSQILKNREGLSSKQSIWAYFRANFFSILGDKTACTLFRFFVGTIVIPFDDADEASASDGSGDAVVVPAIASDVGAALEALICFMFSSDG